MWKPKSTQRGELEQGFIGVGDTRRVRLMERKEKLAWRKKTSPARCLSVKILFYWWLTSGVFIILALCLTLIRFYPHQQLQDSGILKTASWIKLLFLINKLLILFFFFFFSSYIIYSLARSSAAEKWKAEKEECRKEENENGMFQRWWEEHDWFLTMVKIPFHDTEVIGRCYMSISSMHMLKLTLYSYFASFVTW